MIISFGSHKLEKQCNNFSKLTQSFGAVGAKKIRQRLDSIQAAQCLEDLRFAPGRFHELDGNRKGQIAVDLEHPFRLIIEPAHSPVPKNEDGGLDWKQISAVCVLEIVDYH